MNFHQVFIILFLIKCWIKFQLWDENFRIYNLFQRKILHTDIDQGVNFRKLAKKYQNSKVGKMTFGALWLHSGPLCDGLVDCGHSARSQANCRNTKITRNVNVPWYDSLDERAHCARGQPNCRIWQRPVTRCLLTRASMGKSNFYDKMKYKTL